jgi:hypothetical protein
MATLWFGPRCVAVCGAALLLAAGCGGGDSGGGDGGADTSGDQTETAVKEATPATVESALKPQLEVVVLGVNVQTVDCTRKGQDFTCAVKGITSSGQRRSGTVKLKAQGTSGRKFLGSGKLAGPGGSSKFSRLLVDLDAPPPAEPAPTPGVSELEQGILASLHETDAQLIISKLKCPDGTATGDGAKFTCEAKGTYGVGSTSFDIHVTQTDDAGKRFELSGEFDAKEPTGTRHGSFRGVKVVLR